VTIRQVHRWLSLAVAAIWLVQAVTGTLSVFRWEIDDATVAGPRVPVDYAAVGARVDQLDAMADTDVSSVWTSGTSAGRFDVHYSVGDSGRVMRIGGRGRTLRDRSSDSVAAQGAIWDTITSIHTSLLAGESGEWLIGITGVLLLTNIFLGLKLAWPKRKSWRKVLLGRPVGGPEAKLYGWHRKVGLWFALPALLTVSAGVMMVFSDALESALAAQIEDPPNGPVAQANENIGLGAALSSAHRAFPNASFSGVSLPDEDAPWYRVRMRNPGELPRKWGTTVIFVGASDARILGTYDAASPRPERAVVDTLYTLHTGQIGGIIGRTIVLLIGTALLTLIALGVPLWWRRRRPRTARSASARQRPERRVASSPTLD
jgi:uncharacterized iron-regulated membrane protein